MLSNLGKSLRRALPVAVATLTALTAVAQVKPAHDDSHALDLAFTYDALKSSSTNTDTVWFQGGALQLHARFYGGIGAVADATALAPVNRGTSAIPDLIVAVFGPRYTFAPESSRLSAYGQVLAGQANGSHGNFPLGSGPTSDPSNGTSGHASSLAFQPGGGLDVRLSHRIAVRVIQIDYLRTQLPNDLLNVQNNIRIGSGIVLRLAR